MAEQAQTKGGGSKTILIILVVLGLLCACCCMFIIGSTFFAFSATSQLVGGALNDAICSDINVDAAQVYETKTTNNFKQDVTEAEFAAMMEILEDDICPGLTGMDVVQSLQNGTNISYSDDNGRVLVTIDGTFNGRVVHMVLRGQGEDLKIDELEID
ncbi:MAG: hypothetical protein TR69_WS6001001066 [candidate division WS6 bacterium OLB20]|uniref:Uncharacterized protein n=1 Tax=candidate division WS6 bacterium OLB20 TaxID=1617426 RepID=A0A136LZF8_9BACT|nr:MAG: hypothetical protein TR69_WS6001001066 [candidate division WS6 bacterium OLB20]